MSDLIPFEFEGKKLRTAGTWDAPLFHGGDLCALLGFANPRQALASHCEKDDVQKLDALSSGGKQKVNYVTEMGMWRLALGSTSDAARPFQRWVAGEVLPAIRKHGYYNIAQTKIAALLGEHIRPWVELFPRDYWGNLDRLYQVQRPDPEKRPMFYAQLVQLVYETFDTDIHAEMRKRVPKPSKQGVRQHQTLNEVGRECMKLHIARHIGLMDACSSGPEYRELVRFKFGKQMRLPLKGVTRSLAIGGT